MGVALTAKGWMDAIVAACPAADKIGLPVGGFFAFWVIPDGGWGQERSPPDCSLLPPFGKAQSVRAHAWMLRHQIGQTLCPAALWCNNTKQCLNYDGLRIKTRRILKVGGQVPGGDRFDGVDAVPESLVMRGQVAHIGQCMQPRTEDGAVQAEGLGDWLLVLSRQVFERLRNGTER